MPLSPPAPRRHLHDRRVICSGYQRDDGLWDIEGRITDSKTYAHEKRVGEKLPAGAPVHDMWIRITIDDGMLIHEIEAVTDASPFLMCGDVAPNFRRLIGVRIGPGWRRAVRERLGGREGCTHMVELLGPLATVAFQTLIAGRDPDRNSPEAKLRRRQSAERRPYFIDGCHAWASDGPNIQREFPQFYTGPENKAETGD
ncbi:MAG: DUF2889 domain-containing protein [Alphaproteobacteria bacterium]|nr:DUF2889 domain-containing protein [Alphaproteobacteria bacterium]